MQGKKRSLLSRKSDIITDYSDINLKNKGHNFVFWKYPYPILLRLKVVFFTILYYLYLVPRYSPLFIFIFYFPYFSIFEQSLFCFLEIIRILLLLQVGKTYFSGHVLNSQKGVKDYRLHYLVTIHFPCTERSVRFLLYLSSLFSHN